MADVNTNVINQAGTLLASIFGQVSGKTAIAPTNTGEFISLANTTLNYGLDPIMRAMSTLIGRTIFTNRPYTAKLRVLDVTNQEYAWHNRKVSISDKMPTDSAMYALEDGEAIDQQIVNVPNVLQLNIYGENAWQDFYTLFETQVKMALSGPDELIGFLSMVSQNCMDKLEQAKESFKRMALAGYAGALVDYGGDRVVHALTEYNALTGQELTATTVMQDENFRNFVDWLFARMITISDAMTECSQKYHFNVTGHEVQRHTPKEMQKLVMYSPFDHMMTNRVVANTFNAQAFERIDHEAINFWQSINTPDTINVTPGILNASGVKIAGTAVNKAGVLGVLFDRDALGVSVFDEEWRTSPYNARGRYQNFWYSATYRYYADHTENGVLFVLD